MANAPEPDGPWSVVDRDGRMELRSAPDGADPRSSRGRAGVARRGRGRVMAARLDPAGARDARAIAGSHPAVEQRDAPGPRPRGDNESGRPDSNRRPPEPHSGALPDCATSRAPGGRWGPHGREGGNLGETGSGRYPGRWMRAGGRWTGVHFLGQTRRSQLQLPELPDQMVPEALMWLLADEAIPLGFVDPAGAHQVRVGPEHERPVPDIPGEA